MSHIFKQYTENNYRDFSELGRGSYGVVYRAYDIINNKTIVIKEITKKISNGVITNEKAIRNEVEILSYLQDICSARILCYIDFMEDETKFYIITEYLGEYVLLTKFIAETKLTYDQYIIVMENLKEGMHDFHTVGVVHRDIKPDNVMINPATLDIKYIDFGLSCHAANCYYKDKPGSPLYMPPEMIIAFDTPPDTSQIPKNLLEWIWADYWALGMTIMEIAHKSPYCEYYAIKYLGFPQIGWRELIEAAREIRIDGIREDAIVDYCKKYFKQDANLCKYLTLSVLPLLHKIPNQRVLIRSKIDDGIRTFYRDEVTVNL